MKKAEATMRAEYKRSDFTRLERGKFHKEAAKGTTVVLLDPALAKAFPSSEAVNEALRGLLEIAKNATHPPIRAKRPARKRAAA